MAASPRRYGDLVDEDFEMDYEIPLESLIRQFLDSDNDPIADITTLIAGLEGAIEMLRTHTPLDKSPNLFLVGST